MLSISLIFYFLFIYLILFFSLSYHMLVIHFWPTKRSNFVEELLDFVGQKWLTQNLKLLPLSTTNYLI